MTNPIAPDLQAHAIPIGELHPWDANPNVGDLDAIERSLAKFGQRELGLWRTELIDGEQRKVVYSGNHRLLVARDRLGWTHFAASCADDMTPDEIRAYAVATNRTRDLADTDEQAMADLLATLEDQPDLLDATGFDGTAIDELLESIQASEPDNRIDGDPDDIPEPIEGDPITKAGDVWLLGPHRLVCGDSTDTGTLEALMRGEAAIVVHADPPYGMNKNIENDNLHGPKLDAFQMEWWKTCRPHLADNGSAYIWGNAEDLWRLWWRGGLVESERLTFQSEIVWSKGFAQQFGAVDYGNPILRSFNETTERCMFLMLGEQAQSSNADEYWEGWEPIRSYLDGERQKMGWGRKETQTITGTGMHSHWFSKSQWSLPTREHYEAFQTAAGDDAFKREYDDIKREYDDIKREYDDIHAEWLAARAPFDNTHDNMTDVWEFPRVTGDDRHGHETPKPVELCQRVHKTSARDGQIVLVPFAGTGPDFIAGHTTGRRCFAVELDAGWCDTICRRYQTATGTVPILESSGESVSFV